LFLSATIVLPWFFTGYSIVFGLALLTAVVTAYTNRHESTALSPSTMGRYILVDSIFVSLATHPVFFLIQIALTIVGFAPYASSPRYGLLLSFYFVCGFYLCLGVISHMRSSESRLHAMPPIAAVATAALLITTGYPQFSAYRAVQQSRDAGVATYEQATGKHIDQLAKLRIGNSLHGFDGRISTMTVDREGRLLVSGSFEYYAGKDARGLVRLLPDGQLDQTFVPLPPGDPGLSAPSHIRLTADGSMLINTEVRGTTISPMGLTRVRTDGTVDYQFQPVMKIENGEGARIESMDLQPDGRLVVTTPIRFVQRTDNSCLLRFDGNGSNDTAFSIASMEAFYGPVSSRPESITCAISKVTALTTGHLLVEGSFPSTKMMQGIVRLNPDGSQDAVYQPDLSVTQYSMSFATPTGELYAVSYVPILGSSPVAHEARCTKLLPDGKPDPTFNIPSGRFRRIEHLAVQPDGKIVVTGTLGEKDYGVIVRLLPNGQPDPTFGGPEGIMHVDGFLTAIVIQPDGRIVLGGEFQQVIGPSKGQRVDRQNIARLLPNGALDTTFNPR
jgi:uncharacterized delta-60 repeat protein